MKFPYTSNIVRSIETGEEIVLLRPELPLRVYGPAGHVDVLGLVDTAADNSILPISIALDLGIKTTHGAGPGATAFGGQQIALFFADVMIGLPLDGSVLCWRARLYFAEFPNGSEKSIVVGHEGFLDFFTATFFGEDCVLELKPNVCLPAATKAD